MDGIFHFYFIVFMIVFFRGQQLVILTSIMCETSPNGVVPNSIIIDNLMGNRAGFAYVDDPTFTSISPNISIVR